MIVTHEASTAAPPRPIRLPAAARRHGTRLLNQQFWLWGQDIRRQEGNVLLHHGFERMRPPDAVQGSRCYTLRLDPQRTVVLWGFGLFYGDQAHGGLYLSRFRLSPLLGASADAPVGVWTPAQLPPSPNRQRRTIGPVLAPCLSPHSDGSALTSPGSSRKWDLRTGTSASPADYAPPARRGTAQPCGSGSPTAATLHCGERSACPARAIARGRFRRISISAKVGLSPDDAQLGKAACQNA